MGVGMKKRLGVKRGLGVLLILVGIFIIIVQPFSMTGAVINISNTAGRTNLIFGLSLIAVGIVLFIKKTSDLERGIEGISSQKTWQATTKFLREHGLNYFGKEPEKKGSEQYKQDKFEKSMKTGAYSSKSGRHH